MQSLKSLQLTALEMPHSNWQELSAINSAVPATVTQAAAEAAAALTTRNSVNTTVSSSGSTASNKGLTELVLSNSSISLQEMTLVKLQGLRRLQLVGWQGTARQLSAALASSSNTLAELALDKCEIKIRRQDEAAALLRAAADPVAASPLGELAAMLASLPRLEALELRQSCTQFEASTPTTAVTPTETTQAASPVPLLGLRRLDIELLGGDELPTALLSIVSPCTLTRLDLSAANPNSYINDAPALLGQLPQLHQLQHCKLGYCRGTGNTWQLDATSSNAALLAAVRGLSSLTYLCLERGGLTAKELARHMYCKADVTTAVLPQLRVLEIKSVVTWSKPPYFEAWVKMGPFRCGLDPCNVKYDAEVGAVQRQQLASLSFKAASLLAGSNYCMVVASNRMHTWLGA
jgi:hypothetical protein